MELSQTTISNMSHQEKVELLLRYAKECYKSGHKPSKKEIRKKFHMEIYNYFKNTRDYHRKAYIDVSLRNYRKDHARRILINYVKGKAKNNYFPIRDELERKFKIHFSTYFENLRDLYICANIPYSLAQQAIRRKCLGAHQHSKEKLNQQKTFIWDFIRENTAKCVYPGVTFIQKQLNLSFYNLYNNIYEAYRDAGIKYTRPSPILLGKKKEKLLTKIVKKLLSKMNFKIERISLESNTSFNRYADMTVRDDYGNLYLIEIKAYRSDYNLSRREFLQLSEYLKRENIRYGIFITTSTSVKCDYSNIWLINGNLLKKFLEKYALSYYLPSLNWIQKARVDTEERKKYLESDYGICKRRWIYSNKKRATKEFKN